MLAILPSYLKLYQMRGLSDKDRSQTLPLHRNEQYHLLSQDLRGCKKLDLNDFGQKETGRHMTDKDNPQLSTDSHIAAATDETDDKTDQTGFLILPDHKSKIVLYGTVK